MCERLCVRGRRSEEEEREEEVGEEGGGRLSALLVLQRHQYTLDRPFSYAYSQPWLVAGATTAILPSLAAPLEDFYKTEICFL